MHAMHDLDSMHRYRELMDQPHPHSVRRMHLGSLGASKTQCLSWFTGELDGVLSHPASFQSCYGLPHLIGMSFKGMAK